jgi:hypothetical protein
MANARKMSRRQMLTEEFSNSLMFLAQSRRKTVAAPNWVKFTQMDTSSLAGN